MNKFLLIILLYLFPIDGFSQQDYLILHKGDTLYGKFISGMNKSIHKQVQFKTKTGRINLSGSEVKEIGWNNRRYWVYEDPCEGGWEMYYLIIQGKVSYLVIRGNVNGFCEDVVVINNKIYPINTPHLSKEVWPILISCPAFKEKYQKNKEDEPNQKRILMRTKKQVRTWMEMIQFYNQQCGRN